jgi:hypothetical protein
VATEYSDDEMPVYRRWKPVLRRSDRVSRRGSLHQFGPSA